MPMCIHVCAYAFEHVSARGYTREKVSARRIVIKKKKNGNTVVVFFFFFVTWMGSLSMKRYKTKAPRLCEANRRVIGFRSVAAIFFLLRFFSFALSSSSFLSFFFI